MTREEKNDATSQLVIYHAQIAPNRRLVSIQLLRHKDTYIPARIYSDSDPNDMRKAVNRMAAEVAWAALD